MQRWVVVSWALLAVVGAYGCPDGGKCEDGQTCCSHPTNGYECCPFHEAECCGDHIHCCPAETTCDVATSSCVNATGSIPWVERSSADRLSKSFRMIWSYMGEDHNNICPDKSRCPPEFSCLRALTKFGCCPIAQGVPCSDGKHCCPEGHQCSADSRSCIKQELMTTVLCPDGVSECPDETTCCENADGTWGCCPMPKAVCCEDKEHCCPEGTTCDLEQSKCIQSSTRKELPMWAKLPARLRADWENQKEGDQVTAETVDEGGAEKVPEVTTANTVPPSEGEVSVSSVTKAAAGDVPCDDTSACPDNTTCCKTQEGDWSCCPLPEAVCCEDFIHCCPHGKKCNLAAMTCDDDTCSVPMVEKVPAITIHAADVPCDSTASCPDGTTCCKNTEGKWACCPLPEAVCCDDHEHCCPKGTTCDPTSTSCTSDSGSTPMVKKLPAFPTPAPTTTVPPTTPAAPTTTTTTAAPTTTTTTAAPTTTTAAPATTQSSTQAEDEAITDEVVEGEEGRIQCDGRTSCPQSTTCCFMKKTGKWGCCPLPEAVCCADGDHCCPTQYKCNDSQTSCVKGEVVIPWYTKLPASTGVQLDHGGVQCDGQSQCPEGTTCCQLATGEWGCCPMENAVCCPDKEHCCPQGYTCNIASNSCQKVVMLQLETIPLTPVYLPENEMQRGPLKHQDVKCDDTYSCQDGETCCHISATEWACCPIPNAVCCSDMEHCCPAGYTCTDTGDCTQDARLRWNNWHVFLTNKKRALIV